MKRVFLSWGWNVKEAENGFEAMNLINGVNLVLSDLNMPEMDGIELNRKLKSTNKNIPFLLMSGGTDSRGEIKDFLPKPSDVKLIRKKIEEMLTSTSG